EAVEVTREGAKDIVISDTENSIKTLGHYPIETDANSAVVTIDSSGDLKRVFFSNGTYLRYKKQQFKAEPLTGVVTAVDTKTHEVSVKVENTKGGVSGEIASAVVHFTNHYHSLVHPILKMERAGDQIKMTMKDDLLVGIARVKDVDEQSVTTTTT